MLQIDRASFYLLTPQGDMTWGEQNGIDISLSEIGRAFSPKTGELASLTLTELLTEAREKEQKGDGARQYLVELQWRLALSFSCLVFALLSGGVVEWFGHTQGLVGLLATLLTVFVYYVLMLWSRMLAEAAVLPVSGVWLLNIVIAVVAVIALWRQK
jgi:lipopolysaccharide export LptBFGC system permease protein LptF